MDHLLATLSSPAVVAVLAALGTGMVALWQGRDKSKLEERSSYIVNIRADSEQKAHRITTLEKRVNRLEAHLMALWRWSITLEGSLMQNGIPLPDGRPDPASFFGTGGGDIP